MLSRLLIVMFIGLFAAGPADADPVRGAYLAKAGDCQSCHTEQGHAPYSGGRSLTSPFGAIYATNITPDRTYGIGAYSLADFDKAVRKGVAKDGHHLYPAMPYPSFSRASAQDIADLYDYFMHAVAPVHTQGPRTDLPFPFNLRWGLWLWNLFFLPHEPFRPQPRHDAQWNRGAYLVETLGHCGACHTPRGIFYEERDMSAGADTYLTGATQEFWHAPVLRGDARAGLADWSESDIASFLKSGEARHYMAFGAMSEVVEKSTQYLSDADRSAIAHYLKSLPPAPGPNVAPAYATQDQELPGAGLYAQGCSRCHGTSGEGGKDAPALAGNPAIRVSDPSSVVHIVLKGGHGPAVQSQTKSPAMPGFEARLNDREVAEVASFVRQAWGNHASIVDPGEAAKARKALKKEPVVTLPGAKPVL